MKNLFKTVWAWFTGLSFVKTVWARIVRAWQVFVFSVKIFFICFVVFGTLLAIIDIQTKGETVVNQVMAQMSSSTPKLVVPPFLQKIAKCESKTGHYNKNGQVQINSTMDIGKYQINIPAQGARATKMGYDLSKPDDNEKYAVWLFDNEGDSPWNSSKSCWG